VEERGRGEGGRNVPKKMYTDKRCVPEGGLMSALAKLRRDSSKYLKKIQRSSWTLNSALLNRYVSYRHVRMAGLTRSTGKFANLVEKRRRRCLSTARKSSFLEIQRARLKRFDSRIHQDESPIPESERNAVFRSMAPRLPFSFLSLEGSS